MIILQLRLQNLYFEYKILKIGYLQQISALYKHFLDLLEFYDCPYVESCLQKLVSSWSNFTLIS